MLVRNWKGRPEDLTVAENFVLHKALVLETPSVNATSVSVQRFHQNDDCACFVFDKTLLFVCVWSVWSVPHVNELLL